MLIKSKFITEKIIDKDKRNHILISKTNPNLELTIVIQVLQNMPMLDININVNFQSLSSYRYNEP